MSSIATNYQSPLPILFRDLATGFDQQMFFWGRDAIHPDGNLFIESGFQKRPSTGLQGTSCYSLPWQDGIIELHGSHAGWFSENGGFLFIRPLKRCVRWLDSTPPVPGHWPKDQFGTTDHATLHTLAIPFLDWWLAHEDSVSHLAGPGFRDACFRQYKKLPKTRAWLHPAAATRWIAGLRDDPHSLPRARRFSNTPVNA